MTKQIKRLDAEIGITEHDGKMYRVFEFTNKSVHVEPCDGCCFGARINIGPKQIMVNGVIKTINESGYTCNRPITFEPCTRINRNDGMNVYFLKYTAPTEVAYIQQEPSHDGSLPK